jgi:hypothetical protein
MGCTRSFLDAMTAGTSRRQPKSITSSHIVAIAISFGIDRIGNRFADRATPASQTRDFDSKGGNEWR